MTDTVIIYGHSDDLIEIEGAINTELDGYLADETIIEFDDGRQFSVSYDGEWSFDCRNPEQLSAVDYSDIEVYPTGHIPIFNDYSEVVIYRSWNGVNSVEVTSE